MNDPVAAVVNLVAVLVNGEAHTVPAACTLADLIEHLGHVPEGVATAVNGRFVARAQRAGHALAAGDQVNCFQAIVGG